MLLFKKLKDAWYLYSQFFEKIYKCFENNWTDLDFHKIYEIQSVNKCSVKLQLRQGMETMKSMNNEISFGVILE